MRDEEITAGSAGGRWLVGDGVSVTRLPGPRFPMARVMGVGTLLDRLESGRVVRVRLDEGRALAPSEVLSIEIVRDDVAIVETRNHRYEFRRIAGAPSDVAVFPIHDAVDLVEPEDRGFETGVVSIDAWPAPDEPDFVEGARIDVEKEVAGVTKTLGRGILLCDLAAGQPLSMTLGSEVLSTSPVSAVRELGADRMEVRTGNSRYLLRLSDTEKADA